MYYCVECGRKLPSSGECPYCANKYHAMRIQPLSQAVNQASCSYTTLALVCAWTLSLGSLLVFSALSVSPLLLLALPGVPLVVGLWMVYAGEGHTRRVGYTFAIVAMKIMSIVVALGLAALCITCFVAIFLCTSYQDYDAISIPLLILSAGLLIALPVTVVFLHKITRTLQTTRAVLLNSSTKVEGSTYTIVMFVLFAMLLVNASTKLTGAEAFLSEVRTMIQEVIPSRYATVFTLLTGLSWTGMTIPFLLIAVTCIYTAIVLIRYRARLFPVIRQIRRQQRQMDRATEKLAKEKAEAEKAIAQQNKAEAKAAAGKEKKQ